MDHKEDRITLKNLTWRCRGECVKKRKYAKENKHKDFYTHVEDRLVRVQEEK